MSCARLSPPSRRDPVVRRIVTAWRRLAGGTAARDESRPTLVACSGGADSSALLLALSTVRPAPQAAHIVHDMRTPAEADADRASTAELCDALGVRCHVGCARIASEPGNTEANARRTRYSALASIAAEHGLRFVATGHHADDQLETLLMRMIRGAGVAGMGGIRPSRALPGGSRLVRPMLGVTREEARDLCRRCGWDWAEDATNAGSDRLRAALRSRVLPALLEIDPGAAKGAARTAAAMRSAHAALEARARDCEAHAERRDGAVWFARETLRHEPAGVLSVLLMRLHHSIVGEERQDRVSHRVRSTCIGAIQDVEGGERAFRVGGLHVDVAREWVRIS